MDEDAEGEDDRLTRTVEAHGGEGRVVVPASWIGATVEVVRTGGVYRDRADYALAEADGTDAFAVDGGDDGTVYAGADVSERLQAGAGVPRGVYLGLAEDQGGAYHARVPRAVLADGLVVLGDSDERAPALLANLARQGVAGGAAGAVFSRRGPAATRFARALPDERFGAVRVVGGTDGRSVNLLAPGVAASSTEFFDAVDAVADALTSLLVVVAPQLRDAVREFVMAAQGTGATLVDLRELVRHGVDGDDAAVPSWVPERSPDLLERVDAVDREAIEWFLDSLAPFLEEPARSLLADPDPDVGVVDAVRSRAALVVHLAPDRYGDAAWTAVGRALTHMLWGAAREFVPDADRPLVLAGDEFGPVLDAEPGMDRLFARLHRDPVVAAFGVRSPGRIGEEPWLHLAEGVGASATFALDDPAALDRATDLAGVAADRIASLPAGQFWLATGAGDDESGGGSRRLLGYPPYPPERPAGDLPWPS